ncbi:hypothetical protein D3C73_1301020 [compost metagenome]
MVEALLVGFGVQGNRAPFLRNKLTERETVRIMKFLQSFLLDGHSFDFTRQVLIQEGFVVRMRGSLSQMLVAPEDGSLVIVGLGQI